MNWTPYTPALCQDGLNESPSRYVHVARFQKTFLAKDRIVYRIERRDYSGRSVWETKPAASLAGLLRRASVEPEEPFSWRIRLYGSAHDGWFSSRRRNRGHCLRLEQPRPRTPVVSSTKNHPLSLVGEARFAGRADRLEGVDHRQLGGDGPRTGHFQKAELPYDGARVRHFRPHLARNPTVPRERRP
jgi:hypothetical protein